IGLSLWVVGVRFHILISFNRLIAIAFPFKSQQYATAGTTSAAIAIALSLSFLQCAPLVIVDDLWFCYNKKSMQWIFSPNKIGRYYEANFNYLPITIEFGIVLLLDIITLIYLRLAHSNTVQSTSSASSKAVEIRLFKQAFSQSVPILITFTFFAFATPLVEGAFAHFMTTTFMWHFAHGIDGFIIDLFHTRLDLFVK
ncbi:hypothetical protein PENTCL1PPCAC_16571, partial [Pristionchus entomophagus]